MMNKVGEIEFKKIRRISPSQFYSMRNCRYKSLLAEAMNKKPLLPISPNAYYGTVLHKLLELISKGEIINENDFNTTFDEQIGLMEQRLLELGFDFFVPLQKKVKDFMMKKILLKEHLHNFSGQSQSLTRVNYIAEKWYESKDKTIGGKIDLVIEEGNKIEIFDFKTGAITQDYLDDDGEVYSDVKEEYKDQLKLYAYLFYENTGKFPTKLSLVDLAKQKFAVPFSQNECYTVYLESKKLLTTVNSCIDTGIFKANPTESNCKFCLYRPACSFYLNQIEICSTFKDVSGFLVNTLKFQNGNISAYIESGRKRLTVSNLPEEMFDELNESHTKKLYFFNLKRETKDGLYTATKATMIYE